MRHLKTTPATRLSASLRVRAEILAGIRTDQAGTALGGAAPREKRRKRRATRAARRENR